MADHRGYEKSGQVQRPEKEDFAHSRLIAQKRRGGHDDQGGLQADHPSQRQDAPRGKDQYEGQQIQCQRNDPKQRHRRDFAGDVSRHAQEQTGRNQRQRQPAQAAAHRRSVRDFAFAGRILVRGRRISFLLSRARRIDGRIHRRHPPQPGGARRNQHREQPIADRPGAALPHQSEIRLDQERVGQQSRQAA